MTMNETVELIEKRPKVKDNEIARWILVQRLKTFWVAVAFETPDYSVDRLLGCRDSWGNRWFPGRRAHAEGRQISGKMHARKGCKVQTCETNFAWTSQLESRYDNHRHHINNYIHKIQTNCTLKTRSKYH